MFNFPVYFKLYEEIFSTDKADFGGSGLVNGKTYTKQAKIHGQNQYISLTVPAFSTTYYFKKAKKQDKTSNRLKK